MNYNLSKEEIKKYFSSASRATKVINGTLHKLVYYKCRGYADSWHYSSSWVPVESKDNT